MDELINALVWDIHENLRTLHALCNDCGQRFPDPPRRLQRSVQVYPMYSVEFSFTDGAVRVTMYTDGLPIDFLQVSRHNASNPAFLVSLFEASGCAKHALWYLRELNDWLKRRIEGLSRHVKRLDEQRQTALQRRYRRLYRQYEPVLLMYQLSNRW